MIHTINTLYFFDDLFSQYFTLNLVPLMMRNTLIIYHEYFRVGPNSDSHLRFLKKFTRSFVVDRELSFLLLNKFVDPISLKYGSLKNITMGESLAQYYILNLKKLLLFSNYL